ILSRICDMRGGEIFVPKSPTMKLTDLVEAVAPDCEVEVMGIRPGEKIDEELISRHEARQTVDFGDYFAVLPDYADVSNYAALTGSTPVAGDFEYNSQVAQKELSIEQMREILAREHVL
ncbi:MAG TPA: polysaccharide biosynthesis protein, partial [Candidatus Glassbacteria bacterium]|nr:polysaccharide biosynthesis protein [Candidatus Glassbacteria bacterium]